MDIANAGVSLELCMAETRRTCVKKEKKEKTHEKRVKGCHSMCC